METIPKSGLYLANIIALRTMTVLEDVLGESGLQIILTHANLTELVKQLPPENLGRQFDFADYSAIFLSLEDVYGERGGRGMALRAGKTLFKDVVMHSHQVAWLESEDVHALPEAIRLWLGMLATANVVNSVLDMLVTVHTTEQFIKISVQRCPVCWGRTSEKPDCHLLVGLLEAAAHHYSGNELLRVSEEICMASGGDQCQFVIPLEQDLLGEESDLDDSATPTEGKSAE